jgi:hypothetical protein
MSAPAEVPLKSLLVVGEAARACREQLVQMGNHDRINNVGARGVQCCDRVVEDFRHLCEVLRVGLRLEAHRLAHDPEPRAL